MDDLIGKITQGDCLELMEQLPDKCIDLVLTDPPYGIRAAEHARIKTRTHLAHAGSYGDYDWNRKIPNKVYFDEMIRISKNQVIWGGNYFIEFLKNSPCWLVWDKDNTGDFADCELAWTSFKTAVRKFTFRWNGMIQGDMKKKQIRIHPTQKPTQLMEWVLDKYSKKNDLILDAFSGSGTTAIACHKLKRRFICVEKKTEYVLSSRVRLDQEKLKTVLF